MQVDVGRPAGSWREAQQHVKHSNVGFLESINSRHGAFLDDMLMESFNRLMIWRIILEDY